MGGDKQQLALARASDRMLNVPRTARPAVPTFIQKLYEMINDPVNSSLIQWSDRGDSFFVLDHERFAREVLGRWFKHQNFSSFVRQLNMYGFHKIPHLQQGVLKSESDTEVWNFEHSDFLRGQPERLPLIHRKKQTAGGGGPGGIEHLPLPLQDFPSDGGEGGGQVLDITRIAGGIAAVQRQQGHITSELAELKRSNEHLWQEALAARERHKKHQDTINRILKFLAGIYGNGHDHATPARETSNRSPPVVVPRKRQRLMIEDGRTSKGKPAEANDADAAMDDDFLSTRSGDRDASPAVSVNNRFVTVDTPALAPAPSPSVVPSNPLSPILEYSVPPFPRSPGDLPPMPISPIAAESPIRPSVDPLPPPNASDDPASPTDTSLNPTPLNALTTVNNNAPDAAAQAAFAELLNSPGQMSKLLQALASQPNFQMPSAPPPTDATDVLGPALDPATTWSFNSPAPPTRSFLTPPPLLDGNSTEPLNTVAPYDPLAHNTERLSSAYRSAQDVNADVDALQASINALVSNLGLDSGQPPFNNANGDIQQPLSHDMGDNEGDGEADPNAFDFDAFLKDFARQGGADPTADLSLPPLRDGLQAPTADADAAELSAFLDEVASQASASDSSSPVLDAAGLPTAVASPGRRKKRTSEVAKLDGNNGNMGQKAQMESDVGSNVRTRRKNK